jgi:hypothetical protein
MNHSLIIEQLAANEDAFKGLLADVPKELQLWRPAPDKWCLLEIACHLYDEEREDFGARVKLALFTPEGPLVSINPVGWVTERKYLEQDYERKVSDFLKERKESVKWLKALSNPNWKSEYVHPKFGPMSAEFFLANWLAHDYLHFRQISRTKYLFLKEHSEVDVGYAGEW